MTIREIFIFLFINYFFSFFSLVVGNSILSFFRLEQFGLRLFFLRLLIGAIFITTFFALFNSGFRSYLIGLVPLGILILYYYRHKIKLPVLKSFFIITDWKKLDSFFLTNSIIYLITVFIIVGFDGIIYNIHPDFAFYGAISEILNKTGIESLFFDIALNNSYHYVFYHYFELWFGALVIEIFNVNSIQAILLVVFVFFCTLAVYGLYVLVNNKEENDYKLLSLSFLILIISPFVKTIRWLFGLQAGDVPFNITLISSFSIKNSIIVSLLVLLLLFRKKDINTITFITLLIIFVYPSTAVLLFPTLFIWLLYWLRKDKTKSNISFLSVITGILPFLILSYLNKFTDLSGSGIQFASILIYFKNNILKIISEPFIRMIWELVTYSPYIILAFLFLKYRESSFTDYIQQNKSLISLLFIGYVIGSVGIALLSFTANGHQLLSNFYDPLFILLASLLIIKCVYFNQNIKVKYFAFVIILFTLIINLPGITWNKENLNFNKYNNLAKIFDGDKKIAFIHGNKSAYFEIPFGNLRWFTQGYFPVNLSAGFIELNSISDKFDFSSSILNTKYYDELVSQNMAIDLILRENKFDYLIVAKTFDDSLNISSSEIANKKNIGSYYIYELNFSR